MRGEARPGMWATQLLSSPWFWTIAIGTLLLVAAARRLSAPHIPVMSEITPDLEGGARPAPGSWAEREVQAMGFTYCGDFVCDYGRRRARRLLAYLSPDWSHWAMLETGVDDRTRYHGVEFATEFEPCFHLVSTTKALSASPLVCRGQMRVVRPFLASPRVLFRLHLRLCEVAVEDGATAARARPGDFRMWYRDRRELALEELVARRLVRRWNEEFTVSLRGMWMASVVLLARLVRYGPLLWIPSFEFPHRSRLRRHLRRLGTEREEELGEESENAATG